MNREDIAAWSNFERFNQSPLSDNLPFFSIFTPDGHMEHLVDLEFIADVIRQGQLNLFAESVMKFYKSKQDFLNLKEI